MHLADITSALPELALVATALILLVMESATRPHRDLLAPVALAGLGLALIANLSSSSNGAFFSGMLQLNAFTRYLSTLFMVVTAAAIVVAIPYLKRTLEERGEYYSLMLFAAVGMNFMVKAQDLTMLFLGLELLSIPLYILAGFYRNHSQSNEAGLKYLLLGAFSTGFFLFGIALLYGSTGSTAYELMADSIRTGADLSRMLTLAGFGLILIGLGFKVALVPFHMYAPDVYDGAPTAITAFLSTGPKIAGFTALLMLLTVVFSGSMAHLWKVLWVLSAVTMTVGNLSALRQENIKRMLAYSSVAHAGYLLMAILVTNYDSAFGMLYYLVVYSIATLAAFGMVSLLEHDDAEGVTMSRFDGLAGKSPVLGAMFAISMLSLAGFPPTAGFLGKFFIFNAALDAGYTLLVVIAVLNSLVSVYYYLRPIVGIYMRPADTATGEERITIPRVVVPVLVLLVIVAIGAGIYPAPLVRLSAVAISAIL